MQMVALPVFYTHIQVLEFQSSILASRQQQLLWPSGTSRNTTSITCSNLQEFAVLVEGYMTKVLCGLLFNSFHDLPVIGLMLWPLCHGVAMLVFACHAGFLSPAGIVLPYHIIGLQTVQR
jgi:hypothetical protein